MKYKYTTTIAAVTFSAALLFAIIPNLYGYQVRGAMAASSVTTVTITDPNSNPSPVPSGMATNLVLGLRDLWVDHIVYTRNFIISFAAGLPDANVVAARLLKNQEDIGNAIKPFYGEQAGTKLTGLLKGHILGAVSILKAAKAGNTTGAATAEKKWYENADQIATLLASANPNWPVQDLKTMLHNHLALTKSEAVARLTGNYTGDIAAFDKVHRQAMMMSDELAGGIIKQFPDKFSTTVSAAPFSPNSTTSANIKGG
jgi:hypothetical protein